MRALSAMSSLLALPPSSSAQEYGAAAPFFSPALQSRNMEQMPSSSAPESGTQDPLQQLLNQEHRTRSPAAPESGTQDPLPCS